MIGLKWPVLNISSKPWRCTCMWCRAFIRQVKTVSQTLHYIQNCLDKSIHMQLIIHTFYPVFRITSRNQKVKRFDHSIEEMHQNFLFQTKSSWSQTEWLVLICNTLTLQITVCCIKFPMWMIDTIIFSYLKCKDWSNPTYLSGIN